MRGHAPEATRPALASGLVRALLPAMVGGLLLGILAGCATGPTSTAAQQPLPLGTTWRPGLFASGYGPQGLGPSASADIAPTDPSQAVLARVGLTSTDFATGYSVSLVKDGDSLSVASLEFCGATFPSESTRVARRQVVLLDPKKATMGAGSEAVLYGTAADAAGALEQLRAAARACDPTIPFTVAGGKITVTQTATDDIDVTGFVASGSRVLIAASFDDAATTLSARTLTVWQVRGPLLVALQLTHAGTDPFTDKDRTNFHLIASTLATRLASVEPTLTSTP